MKKKKYLVLLIFFLYTYSQTKAQVFDSILGSKTIYNIESINQISDIEVETIGGVQVRFYKSCKDILENNQSIGDGLYVIDPDQAGPVAPFRCYCDMTTDGGGWTRISYNSDLPHARQFSGAEFRRWLDSNFSLTLTDEQINAIRSVSTEGKQFVKITCEGVLVYRFISGSTNRFDYAFAYRFHTGFETSFGQTYPSTNITINTDGCLNNDSQLRETTLDVYDIRVPIINFNSRDNAGSSERFGSPLTNNPAWLR